MMSRAALERHVTRIRKRESRLSESDKARWAELLRAFNTGGTFDARQERVLRDLAVAVEQQKG
jgi:hypothetical protein